MQCLDRCDSEDQNTVTRGDCESSCRTLCTLTSHHSYKPRGTHTYHAPNQSRPRPAYPTTTGHLTSSSAVLASQTSDDVSAEYQKCYASCDNTKKNPIDISSCKGACDNNELAHAAALCPKTGFPGCVVDNCVAGNSSAQGGDMEKCYRACVVACTGAEEAARRSSALAGSRPSTSAVASPTAGKWPMVSRIFILG